LVDGAVLINLSVIRMNCCFNAQLENGGGGVLGGKKTTVTVSSEPSHEPYAHSISFSAPPASSSIDDDCLDPSQWRILSENCKNPATTLYAINM
jgi:hypothetical protein